MLLFVNKSTETNATVFLALIIMKCYLMPPKIA